MYLDEGHRSEDEAVLAKLKKTVEEAYKSCIGEAEGNMTSVRLEMNLMAECFWWELCGWGYNRGEVAVGG